MLLWPCKVAVSRPVTASRTRATLSDEAELNPGPDAVTIRALSGEKAALITSSLWPLGMPIFRIVAMSQMRAILSSPTVTARAPSGEKPA